MGNKLLHHKFTTKNGFFFHGVQTSYDIYMNNKNQSMLYDSLGNKGHICYENERYFCKLIVPFFLDLIFGGHMKGTSLGKTIFLWSPINLQLKTWIGKKIPLIKVPEMTLLRKILLVPWFYPKKLLSNKRAFKWTKNILSTLFKWFSTQ